MQIASPGMDGQANRPLKTNIISQSLTPEMESLKSRLKTMWESGDYGTFARFLEKGALEFFESLNITPGSNLLDVGCGAGQLLIPAARRGIKVTGLDLAANLVQQARARADAEGLPVTVDEGDAEDLPYPDKSFDVVLSFIGSMFAPRPDLVASEMVRVCKPGGKIIMGNWTPEGHVGQMFKVIGKHVPPPAIFPSPLLWGNEVTCRERLSQGVQEVRIRRRMYPMEYPFPPEEVVNFFIEYYGPTNRAYSALSKENQKAFHKDLTSLWTLNNRAKDNMTTLVYSEYLEVIGTRV